MPRGFDVAYEDKKRQLAVFVNHGRGKKNYLVNLLKIVVSADENLS